GTKPAATKPEATKPAETVQTKSSDAESELQKIPMGNWHDQKTKTPGYSASPNRYYARKIPYVEQVQTNDWNEQKIKTPGYTAPSNKYFATKYRMAIIQYKKRPN
ncbi:MAG: trans-sialidase, partial [Nitrosopumilaceae archaeon]|nr:trans-sialidase [Nitrosopumilaceae archaeon]